jgi:hypothetical protein
MSMTFPVDGPAEMLAELVEIKSQEKMKLS